MAAIPRAARPPSFPDVRRRAEVEQQLGRRAAARRDADLGVRVGPHVLGDRPLQRRFLAHVIERGRSMMRERGSGNETGGNGAEDDAEYAATHGPPPTWFPWMRLRG